MLGERPLALSIAGPHIDAHTAFRPNVHHQIDIATLLLQQHAAPY